MTPAAPPPPAGMSPTVASARIAGAVAARTAVAGIPAASVAAYFLSLWHPGGHPLPDPILGACAAIVTAAAGLLWHLAEIGIAKLETIK
jgi:hypothetical protein